MKIRKTYTFDDVLLLPKSSSVMPATVNPTAKITDNITLKIPLFSAAMDTVRRSDTAIAIAREGGGVITKT